MGARVMHSGADDGPPADDGASRNNAQETSAHAGSDVFRTPIQLIDQSIYGVKLRSIDFEVVQSRARRSVGNWAVGVGDLGQVKWTRRWSKRSIDLMCRGGRASIQRVVCVF